MNQTIITAAGKSLPSADGARNYSQCDSMLIGNKCQANRFPILVKNSTAVMEHRPQHQKLMPNGFSIYVTGLDMERAFHLSSMAFVKMFLRNFPWVAEAVPYWK